MSLVVLSPVDSEPTLDAVEVDSEATLDPVEVDNDAIELLAAAIPVEVDVDS
nr:hypothetical protein [Burkholderia lata]